MNRIEKTFRLIATALLAVIAVTVAPEAKSQTMYTSDEINNAILLSGSIVPEWIQDETNPWQVNGKTLCPYSTSETTIQYSFTSEYPCLIMYSCSGGISSWDGERWSYMSGFYIRKVDAGEHNISIFGRQSSGNISNYVYDFGIFEIKDGIDANAIRTSKSKDFEIVNDAENPWAVAGNELVTTKKNVLAGNQEVVLKFDLDKVTALSWESCETWNYAVETVWGDGFYVSYQVSIPRYRQYRIYDNDKYIDYKYPSGNGSWVKQRIVLEPGHHEVKIIANQYGNNRDYRSEEEQYFIQSHLRNIELNDEWFEVDIVPGDLGNSVIDEISKAGYAYLTDVELLKVKGRMNSADWDRIHQMTNLKALDLQETDIVDFPAEAFKDNQMMSYIVFPDGLQTIGDAAFYRSNIKYLHLPEGLKRIVQNSFLGCKIRNLTIPASVEYIGNSAFQETWIETLNFAEDAKLTTLGVCAFRACKNLKSVVLPNSLTSFPTTSSYYKYVYSSGSTYTINAAFSGCVNLEHITFPKSMKVIPQSFCIDTNKLQSVDWPEDLEVIERYAFSNSSFIPDSFPETLKYINHEAFYCDYAPIAPTEPKDVVFPESLRGIREKAFMGRGLETVNLPLHLGDLGVDAFRNNKFLKKVRLHSGATNLPNFLTDCPNLETIVMPCATPPSRSGADILGTQNKKNINLIVPDFALSSYRLDDYWYTYGAINSGDEADNVDYWNVIGKLTMREGRRMQGTPDVEISQNGGMMVLGSTPASVNSLTINMNETAPAAFYNNCEAFSTNDVTVNFSVAANKWYFFTPMFDINVEDIEFSADCAYVIRYYDAETRASNGKGASWKNVTEPILKAGQGYIIQCDQACNVIFKDSATDGFRVLSTEQQDVELASIDAETAANANWNFVGNPYPSYFDIWYMDVDAPITVYENNTYRALSITDDSYALRPMQAFFIQKPSEDASAIFNLEGRQISNQIGAHRNAPARRRPAAANRALFNLELSDASGNVLDRTRVVINEAASEAYEMRCDAAKFMATEKNVPQLYTIDADKTRLAINERPLASGSVDLGLISGEEKEYVISASRADGRVMLVDDATGISTDISEAPCTIFTSKNSTIDNRFHLHFIPQATTEVESVAEMLPSVSAEDGVIVVKNPGEADFAIYAADGMMIANGNDKEVSVNVSGGVYLVRIADNSYKVLVK